jgi:hypothetical protein
MYSRALQGYEEALGPQLLPSYLPALNTMFCFGDLYARTSRKDEACIMYNHALAGYTAVQGPSSKWCKQLRDRLKKLQAASLEPKDQAKSAEVEATRSISLKRIFRKFRKLDVG